MYLFLELPSSAGRDAVLAYLAAHSDSRHAAFTHPLMSSFWRAG